MTWGCLGSCVLSFPLLIVLKEHFYRLDVEMSDSEDEDEDDDLSTRPVEA